jgi:hypothetical protein
MPYNKKKQMLEGATLKDAPVILMQPLYSLTTALVEALKDAALYSQNY